MINPSTPDKFFYIFVLDVFLANVPYLDRCLHSYGFNLFNMLNKAEDSNNEETKVDIVLYSF
jgi:hypothetical protein